MNLDQLPLLFMQFTTAGEFNDALIRIGAFEFILPFLLIFALVFGVLTSTNILGANKGVNAVIAFVIGLMALQLGFVQSFFIELFPRLAIGLAMILGIVILTGLFIPSGSPAKGWFIGFGIGGVVIALGAIIATFDELFWFGSFWQNFWPQIVGGIVVVILIIFITIPAKSKDRSSSEQIIFKPFRE